MAERRWLPVIPVMATFAAIILLLAAYFGAYVLLNVEAWTSYQDENNVDREVTVRLFRYEWLATLFAPAGRIEDAVRPEEVRVVGPNDPDYQITWD